MRNIITVCKRGFRRTRMYTSEHVNIMKNMLDRHGCEYDNFVCISDQTEGMPSDIELIAIPDIPKHKGWWSKIETFNPKLPVTGDNLYIDLDCVVVDNIDCLWEYEQGGPVKLINVSDFYAKHTGYKFNSSVYRYTISDFIHIWEDYQLNYEQIQRNYPWGDEKYTTELDKNSKMFPKEWIINYSDESFEKLADSLENLIETNKETYDINQAKYLYRRAMELELDFFNAYSDF